MNDLLPLFRSIIGFDTLANTFSEEFNTFPPYDIKRVDEGQYEITMAVAGFKKEDIELEIKNGVLSIFGSQKKEEKTSEHKYLYRGIAQRNFQRQFKLADYVKVTNATLEDGLLKIELKRELPEELQPKKITLK